MNQYTRDMTSKDINALGPDWHQRIDGVITTMIETAAIANDPKSANARVLEVMGAGVPMTVAGIVTNHNVIHGAGSMALNYGRFVINVLHKAGMINRIRHGVYVREEQ